MPTALRVDAIHPHSDKPRFDSGLCDAASILVRLKRESLALDELRAALEFDESLQRSGDRASLYPR